MNNVTAEVDVGRGILLTDRVDMAWLESVYPRFYDDYIKFVVDFERRRVHVGMDISADCILGNMGSAERDRRFRGGNIFFADGHMVYESTLNIHGNLALGGTFADIRAVEDERTITRIDEVLKEWIVI